MNNFTFTSTTGEFRVGEGNSQATLTLASASNSITAAGVQIGNSHVSGGQDNNANSGKTAVHLGGGTNVINTNTLTIGLGKSGGNLDFGASAATGSLSIAGFAGGTSTANIMVGSSTSATGGNDDSELNLASHNVTVQGGAVTIGVLAADGRK